MDLQRAEKLANELMHKHGLFNKYPSWMFEFDNARRRFGRCHYRSNKITLSKHLTELNDEAMVKNTILHEIAHALVGRNHGHDSIWKQKSLEIGCDGHRCYDKKQVTQPKAKYEAVCSCCNRTYKKFRISNKLVNYSCSLCSKGNYNPEYKLEFKAVA